MSMEPRLTISSNVRLYVGQESRNPKAKKGWRSEGPDWWAAQAQPFDNSYSLDMRPLQRGLIVKSN